MRRSTAKGVVACEQIRTEQPTEESKGIDTGIAKSDSIKSKKRTTTSLDNNKKTKRKKL